jgi:hypothetical protein
MVLYLVLLLHEKKNLLLFQKSKNKEKNDAFKIHICHNAYTVIFINRKLKFSALLSCVKCIIPSSLLTKQKRLRVSHHLHSQLTKILLTSISLISSILIFSEEKRKHFTDI